jgi:hypothetical protein
VEFAHDFRNSRRKHCRCDWPATKVSFG